MKPKPQRKVFTVRKTGLTMTAMTTHREKQGFLDRLEQMIDEVPVSKEEALETLAEEGLDGEAAWRRIQTRIAVWEETQAAQSREERFARARQRREEILHRVADQFARRTEELAARSREELLAMLSDLQRSGGPVQVFHRKLTEMSNQDLASLIAHYEDANQHAEKK